MSLFKKIFILSFLFCSLSLFSASAKSEKENICRLARDYEKTPSDELKRNLFLSAFFSYLNPKEPCRVEFSLIESFLDKRTDLERKIHLSLLKIPFIKAEIKRLRKNNFQRKLEKEMREGVALPIPT